jgi:hypothetical protein
MRRERRRSCGLMPNTFAGVACVLTRTGYQKCTAPLKAAHCVLVSLRLRSSSFLPRCHKHVTRHSGVGARGEPGSEVTAPRAPADGRSVQFRVPIRGRPLRAAQGSDVDEQGRGTRDSATDVSADSTIRAPLRIVSSRLSLSSSAWRLRRIDKQSVLAVAAGCARVRRLPLYPSIIA